MSCALTPCLAILSHELRGLSASWLVRLWLGATAVLALVITAGNWPQLPSAPLIAIQLFPFLVFPWFLVVMVLSVSPVAGTQAEAIADGILSRPVTRYEYLLASWAARVLLVLGVYLIVIIPVVALVALAKRPAPPDPVTFYGTVATISIVGLVLTFQVSVGLLLGTILRRPFLALVIFMFLWVPVNLVLNTFALEELSPISLNRALPTLLRTPWRTTGDGAAGLDQDPDMETRAREAAAFLQSLWGSAAEPAPRKQEFFDSTAFEDFSVVRVLLGYGIPTALAVGLATLCFCLRDL